jgi:hypothetical protein
MGTTVVKRNASNIDLQKAIEAAIPTAVAQMKVRSNEFKGKTEAETCKKIFDYLKNQITYKADGAEQQVRVPSGLIRTRQGDCKSYSVFTSAVLTNLGIPHKLVYASYDPSDSTPTHIYVTTNKGCIIDAVYGKFNAEKQATNKKYKNMNISYIAGMGKNRRIGSMGKYGTGGACGIGAVNSGKDWAQSNGLMPYQSELWLSANNALYRKYALNKANPLAIIGRGFVRKLIEKNAGGFGNSLFKLRQDSKTAKSTDPAYQKMRAIEIDWLERGGNPYELYESIDEGNKKTPTGAYFNKLMKMKAGGYNPNVAQWIAAAVSVVFGKKYDEATGKITGSDMGIGVDPVTDTAAAVSSAPWWATMVSGIIGTLGTAYIVAKVGEAPGETNLPPDGTGDGSNNQNNQPGTGSMLLPILLVGGAAAAYFILKPSKK